MRTYHLINERFIYPDIVVGAGKPIFKEDEKMDNLMNPVMIVEVLSPSAAVHDKTDKFIACKTIPTIKRMG